MEGCTLGFSEMAKEEPPAPVLGSVLGLDFVFRKNPIISIIEYGRGIRTNPGHRMRPQRLR